MASLRIKWNRAHYKADHCWNNPTFTSTLLTFLFTVSCGISACEVGWDPSEDPYIHERIPDANRQTWTSHSVCGGWKWRVPFVLAEPTVSISCSWAERGLKSACSAGVSSVSGSRQPDPHAIGSPGSSAASPPSETATARSEYLQHAAVNLIRWRVSVRWKDSTYFFPTHGWWSLF